jgi:hypothetical protein
MSKPVVVIFVLVVSFGAFEACSAFGVDSSAEPMDAQVDAPADSTSAEASPTTYFDFLSPSNWEAFALDTVAGGTGDLFHESATTGHYVLYLPRSTAVGGYYSQSFLLFDRDHAFGDASSWRWVDAAGHRMGVATHDSYVYFSPGATDTAARWNAANPATAIESYGLNTGWLAPAVADGEHVYFLPSYNPNLASGDTKVYRYDVLRPFADAFSWSAFDLGTLAMASPLRSAALFASGALYAFPREGCVLFRYDTGAPFTAAGWSGITSPYCGAAGREGFSHPAFDGRYAYLPISDALAPDGGAVSPRLLVRFDTSTPAASDAWKAMDLSRLGPSGSAPVSAVFDGRHVFVLTDGGSIYRYDSRLPFEDPGSWLAQELSSVAGGLSRYAMAATAFDGEYVYCLPGVGSSRTLRFHARTPRGTTP